MWLTQDDEDLEECNGNKYTCGGIVVDPDADADDYDEVIVQRDSNLFTIFPV